MWFVYGNFGNYERFSIYELNEYYVIFIGDN